MMEYNEFSLRIKEEMEKALINDTSIMEVGLTSVAKNNVPDEKALIIRQEGLNISPVIYLSSFYEEYKNGRTIQGIVNRIKECFYANTVERNFDTTLATDFEKVKKLIIPKLYPAENNETYLQGKVYTPVEDLAVTYHIYLGEHGNSVASIPVSNELFDMYGISKEELHKLAFENNRRLCPVKFMSMGEELAEIAITGAMIEFGISREEATAVIGDMYNQDNFMYVLSNQQLVNGAVQVLDKEVMDLVAQRVGEKFFVIPSSIHECLIIPYDEKKNYKELEEMVRDVNLTEVEEKDILSWHAYQVDAKNHLFYRCDRAKEVELQLAKETEERIDKTQEHCVTKAQQKKMAGPKL